MNQLKKDITFIYMDAAEQAIYKPIADEAKKRGYKVTLTDNKLAKCEIGFYCQHVNFPVYSNFSVIMLHDIVQQYSNWPDIWYLEPWNEYDVGILPSKQWEDNWEKCSQYYYTRPKIGVFRIGWPKADIIAKIDREKYKKEFNQKYGLDDNRRTILYAPSWENDNKQKDFVESLRSLNVNLLVKQASVDPITFPDMYKAINEMYEFYKDDSRLVMLSPETNIFDAIAASDILVSDESSTMCEAEMMGVPSISVSNWLIPDTTPSRFPECNYDFVIMTLKENLAQCVSNILNNYNEYAKATLEFREHTFGNIGNTSGMIMDIIDDCVNGKKIRYSPLHAKKDVPITLGNKAKHDAIIFIRRGYYKYLVYKIKSPLGFMWRAYHNIKHRCNKKRIF